MFVALFEHATGKPLVSGSLVIQIFILVELDENDYHH